MGWLYMVVCALAVGVFYGIEPRIGFYISIAVLAISFGSFCLLYDEPRKRAGHRVTEQMGRLSARGLDANEYQRLQSMKITATEDDKKFRLTVMSGVNVASGIAGGLMLLWALAARLW